MQNAESLLEKARSLESSGQDQAALDLYARAAAEAAEPDPAVLVRMGAVQLRLGKAEQAAESFSRSAELLAGAGLRNGAIALWRRVLRIRPDSAPTLLRLAELDAREGYAREARESLARYAESGDPGAGAEALRARLAGLPADDPFRRLLAERLGLPGAAAPEPEPPAPAAAEDERLEVLGSGWEAPDLPSPDEPGIDLLPTRIEGEEPSEDEVAPLAGLEPTLLEGLEPTSLEPGARPEEPSPADEDDEPLALLGSDELPLIGPEGTPDEKDALMRRVEEAVRAGDGTLLVEALLALGRHLDSEGLVERAREVFGRVLELVPEHEEARRALADLRSR